MRVLIIEDDINMRRMLRQLLEKDGYDIAAVSDGAAALAEVLSEEPDLVLLDVVLGEEDGRQVLLELRQLSDVPVVFLTGRGLEMDRIAGLKMGADDYVVKPFSSGELSARIESVLRRRGTGSGGRTAPSGLQFDHLRIDPVTREVRLRGRLIELTAKEFDLLLFLASSPRQVFSRQQILGQVWSSSNEWQDQATVTEHVRRLRLKIEADPEQPQRITTIRGVGYRFEPHVVGRGAPPEPLPLTHSA
jgi:two-component system, OmpR family, phosphate regulon response regulator PhoB